MTNVTIQMQADAGTVADVGAASDAAPRLLIKTMSLSETEFRAGIAALGGEVVAVGDAAATGVVLATAVAGQESVAARIAVAGVGADAEGGVVGLLYEPLAPRRLGGLLVLPQAKVTLTFSGLDAGGRLAFERRFWVTFQRGGG